MKNFCTFFKSHLFKSTLILIGLFVLSFESSAQIAGWRYEIPVSIRNSGSALTDVQVLFRVNTQALIAANFMKPDGSDIRVASNCGNPILDHWLEGYINTDSTKIWVKIPSIPANDSVRVFLFFGNPAGTSTSTLAIFNGPHSATDSVVVASPNTVSLCQRGFRFTPNQELLVTHFGKRIPNATQRYVTLFNFNTQAIVAQIQVDPGVIGNYNYNPLTTPIWLAQGTQYVLELFNATGDMYWYGTSSQIGQHLTYGDMRYCNSCTQNTFPTNILTNYHYGTPDFWYYVKQTATPEPTYLAGLIGDTNTPAAPTNLVGIAGNQQAQLRWNRNTEIDAAKYFVYRNTTNNPNTATLIDSTNHPDTAYTNTGLTNGTTYYFWVTCADRFCVRRISGFSNVATVTPLAIASQEEQIPKTFALYQNYPNPFNPTTLIRYDVPKASFVTLVVYDLLGREVTKLVNEKKVAAKYEVELNGQFLPSGVYIYKVTAGDFTDTKKMVLVK